MIDIKALDVDSCWSDASEVLKDAIDMSNGRHTIETTYEGCKLGTMSLYGVFYGDAILSYFVTTQVIYPNKKILGIIFCGGDRVIKFIKEIEHFFKLEAIKENCKGLEIIGRKGWDRIIKNTPNLEFKAKGIFYEMDA